MGHRIANNYCTAERQKSNTRKKNILFQSLCDIHYAVGRDCRLEESLFVYEYSDVQNTLYVVYVLIKPACGAQVLELEDKGNKPL